MHAEPSGISLLDAAYLLLRDDILQLLPSDKRHGALMIARTMSITIRQMKNGDIPAHEELQLLNALLEVNENPVLPDSDSLQMRLIALNRQLISHIRRGDADEGTKMHDPVFSLLRQVTKQRVLESNPKVIEPFVTTHR